MALIGATKGRQVLWATVLCWCLALPGAAGALELDDVMASAEAGDAAAQGLLGQGYLYGMGGLKQDVAAGLDLLDKAAAGGDAEAQAVLGEALFYGLYGAADPQQGLRLLNAAVEAGHVGAHRKLGTVLLWGGPVEADPQRARRLLARASEAGDVEAQRTLGEQLVTGWVLDPDPDTGLQLLEQAVAAGDPTAKLKLGKILTYGTNAEPDQDRARVLFEAAAEAGHGEGLEVYGTQLMWSGQDPEAAEAYLRRAGELGRGSAWTTIAEGMLYGYLKGKSAEDFREVADLASAAGDEKIALVEANRHMWGRLGAGASGRQTLAVLEQAAEAGNRLAARRLIALTRDGNGYSIRRRPETAETYLARYSDLLDPQDIRVLETTLDIATARRISDFARLADVVQAEIGLETPEKGAELFNANPNFAVYLLQGRMRENGTYRGAINGRATEKTMRALVRECRKAGTLDNCSDGPLRADVVGTLLAM